MIRPRHSSATRRVCGLAIILIAGQFLVPPRYAAAADITLNETGSSLLYPLFQAWITDYVHVAPDVKLTADPTGSGVGMAAAIAGEARIGASDAYMSDEEAEQHKGIMDIPLAISAQTVNYNIPELNDAGLKLDGSVLAGIYAGRITMWDAAPIAALNPAVKLPHQAIVPLRREDASGDTFIFTQFLDFSAPGWEDDVGYGTTVSWPKVDGEKTANGNDGMVRALAGTPYAIAYVGISFRAAITKAHLGTALLKNQDGKFLLPTPGTISAGASGLDSRTPADERLTLVFAPGSDAYPLVNYEYAVVSVTQPNPQTAAALRAFLQWAVAVEGGNAPKYLDTVGFIPLPDFVRALSEKQIARIK